MSADRFDTEVPQPASAGQVLLEARDLTKSYDGGGFLVRRPSNVALNGVSLTLRAGEIVGLVGESGCGKSTFAKLLLGLETSDRGSLSLGGRPIFGLGTSPVPPARRQIHMVFQDPYGSLNPRMRVVDLVSEGLQIRGGLSRKRIREQVQRILALVGLSPDAIDKFAHQFSGGQRQRLAIARAIIMDPQVLIADEATSALDVSVQMQILNLLLDLRDELNLTILFISHDMGVIEYLCDRVAVMYRGRIVEEAATRSLIERPLHPYAAHLISARPRVGRAKVHISTAAPPDTTPSPGACVYVQHCPRRKPRCLQEMPPLQIQGGRSVACFNPLPQDG